jgi:hypothetical protein
MGVLLQLECLACGYEVQLLSGFGFEAIEFEPCRCLDCRQIVSVAGGTGCAVYVLFLSSIAARAVEAGTFSRLVTMRGLGVTPDLPSGLVRVRGVGRHSASITPAGGTSDFPVYRHADHWAPHFAFREP